MANIIRLRIDVSEIDKDRLFQGKKGLYLNAAAIPTNSKYDDTHMIVQDVSEEERKQGIKGNILGNATEIIPQSDRMPSAGNDGSSPSMNDDDIPF